VGGLYVQGAGLNYTDLTLAGAPAHFAAPPPNGVLYTLDFSGDAASFGVPVKALNCSIELQFDLAANANAESIIMVDSDLAATRFSMRELSDFNSVAARAGVAWQFMAQLQPFDFNGTTTFDLSFVTAWNAAKITITQVFVFTLGFWH